MSSESVKQNDFDEWITTMKEMFKTHAKHFDDEYDNYQTMWNECDGDLIEFSNKVTQFYFNTTNPTYKPKKVLTTDLLDTELIKRKIYNKIILYFECKYHKPLIVR